MKVSILILLCASFASQSLVVHVGLHPRCNFYQLYEDSLKTLLSEEDSQRLQIKFMKLYGPVSESSSDFLSRNSLRAIDSSVFLECKHFLAQRIRSSNNHWFRTGLDFQDYIGFSSLAILWLKAIVAFVMRVFSKWASGFIHRIFNFRYRRLYTEVIYLSFWNCSLIYL